MKVHHELLYQKGFEYYWGLNHRTRDPNRAKKLLEEAAVNDNVAAQYLLKIGFEASSGNARELKEVVEQLKRDAEVRNQFTQFAQCNLGFCYEEGLVVAKNEKNAVELYELAANQNNVWALINLGSCLANARGVGSDIKRAQELYRRAAELGNPWGKNRLGLCYYNAQNYQEAFQWYQSAANQGYHSALYNVGLCYEEGRWVTQNKRHALQYYRRAAREGEVKALEKLASWGDKIYQSAGRSAKANDEKRAVELYLQAAIQGHPKATSKLKRLCKKPPLLVHYLLVVEEREKEYQAKEAQAWLGALQEWNIDLIRQLLDLRVSPRAVCFLIGREEKIIAENRSQLETAGGLFTLAAVKELANKILHSASENGKYELRNIFEGIKTLLSRWQNSELRGQSIHEELNLNAIQNLFMQYINLQFPQNLQSYMKDKIDEQKKAALDKFIKDAEAHVEDLEAIRPLQESARKKSLESKATEEQIRTALRSLLKLREENSKILQDIDLKWLNEHCQEDWRTLMHRIQRIINPHIILSQLEETLRSLQKTTKDLQETITLLLSSGARNINQEPRRNSVAWVWVTRSVTGSPHTTFVSPDTAAEAGADVPEMQLGR